MTNLYGVLRATRSQNGIFLQTNKTIHTTFRLIESSMGDNSLFLPAKQLIFYHFKNLRRDVKWLHKHSCGNNSILQKRRHRICHFIFFFETNCISTIHPGLTRIQWYFFIFLSPLAHGRQIPEETNRISTIHPD